MTVVFAKTVEESAGRKRISYDEYLRLASETHINEWVNGEMITYMPPFLKHQELSGFLYNLFSTFISDLRLGKVVQAPFEVKLWPDGPSREPDILFVGNNKSDQLGEKRFEGGPDLVVEIVSTGSVREDKVRKFDEYEQAGVAEYWIIDPRQRFETAEFFQLDESDIYQPIEVDEDGIYRSAALPGFWLNVDWLWMDPLPNHQLKVAEIAKDNTAVPEELRRLYTDLFNLLSQS